MTYTEKGYGDAATWQPCTGHPNDPRTDESRDELIEANSKENARIIRRSILTDDETAVGVADFLGRYISDLDIVDIIRAVLRGDEAGVFQSMKDQMEDAICHLAEERAIYEVEKMERDNERAFA